MDLSKILDAGAIDTINISVSSFIYAIISTIISTFILRHFYIRYGKSMNNKEYFANIFVLLGLTTCSVIVIVKYSLALSLGLVGALSIVRFRAAIKEPEELVFLFLVIALGLAFGANQFIIGYVLLAASILIIFFSVKIFSNYNNLDQNGLVIIISGNKNDVMNFYEKELVALVKKTNTAFLKEINLEDDDSRIVIKISSSKQTEKMLEDFIKKVETHNLKFNLISDISNFS